MDTSSVNQQSCSLDSPAVNQWKSACVSRKKYTWDEQLTAASLQMIQNALLLKV